MVAESISSVVTPSHTAVATGSGGCSALLLLDPHDVAASIDATIMVVENKVLSFISEYYVFKSKDTTFSVICAEITISKTVTILSEIVKTLCIICHYLCQ